MNQSNMLGRLALLRDNLFDILYKNESNTNCPILKDEASSLLLKLKAVFPEAILINDIAGLLYEMDGVYDKAILERKLEIKKIKQLHIEVDEGRCPESAIPPYDKEYLLFLRERINEMSEAVAVQRL